MTSRSRVFQALCDLGSFGVLIIAAVVWWFGIIHLIEHGFTGALNVLFQ